MFGIEPIVFVFQSEQLLTENDIFELLDPVSGDETPGFHDYSKRQRVRA